MEPPLVVKERRTPEARKAKMDEVQDGIYRISAFVKDYGITFNVFLLTDEKSALIHTGPIGMYEAIEEKVREVIHLKKLHYVSFLHFESDEYGGMKFLKALNAKLVCSRLSSQLNLQGWHDVAKDHISVWEGERISLGRKKLRFLMTPHIHHWDSMMVFEETQRALFPSDLFLQQGDNPPVTNDPKLTEGMIKQYRMVGIFAHEKPIREMLPKLERLRSKMIHAMHGSSLDSSVHKYFFDALRTQDFAYTRYLLGEEVPAQALPI